MGIPMYTCTSMYLNTRTTSCRATRRRLHSPSPQPPAWQILTALCLSSSFSSNTCDAFHNWWSKMTSFCLERCPWQSCTAGGGRTSHAFTSIFVSKGSIRWRLAWCVTDVCESTQHECENFPNWWLILEDNHSSSNRSLWRWTPGRLVCRVEGVQRTSLRARSASSASSTSVVATDTTAGEPFNFFLPKSKSSSSRSSVLSACRSIFTKQNVPVVTHDGPAHYNVCTYFGMPIKLFLFVLYLAKTPSPLFVVGNTGLKKFRKLRTTPKPSKDAY